MRNRTPRNIHSNADQMDDSDPDDDKPLHLMVATESPIRRTRPVRQHTNYSDDNVSASQPGPSSSARSVRTQRNKRPYYNEDSDEEEEDDGSLVTPTSHRTKRRMFAQSSQSSQNR